MLSEAQRVARSKGIGGSDSPIVLGVSPFVTPKQLYYLKRGEAQEQPETPAMLRGKYLEAIVAQLYGEKTGRQLRKVNRTLTHPKHEWMVGNVDREILKDERGPGILEIKCPGLRMFANAKHKGLPPYYSVQMQHYLAVAAKKWGAFAVFSAERWELLFFDVERDDELINLIIEHGAEFWKAVQEGRVPHDEVTPSVELPSFEPTELVTIDDPAWTAAIESLMEAKEIMKEAEGLESEAKETIQNLMTLKGCEVAEGAGARIYFREQPGRESFDWRAFQKAHPEMDLAPFLKRGKPIKSFRSYILRRVEHE